MTVYATTYAGGEAEPGVFLSVSHDGGESFNGKIQAHPEAGYSDAPALTLDENGAVRIVWHAKVDGPRRLYTAVSTDGGES